MEWPYVSLVKSDTIWRPFSWRPIDKNEIFANNHHSKIFRSATDLRLSWFVYLYFAHWEQYFELNIFFKSYPHSKNSTKMKLLSIFALCARAAIQVPGIFKLNLVMSEKKSLFNSCVLFRQFCPYSFLPFLNNLNSGVVT